ncbi:hypothetical protein AA313_de0206886 [Arthrobotrys entomopaga]|nr:hypothetical protein AA313_de0206886 [Arthrobotrys entomopaga]
MATSDDIKPFTINIQKDKLDLLKKKLDVTTFPDATLNPAFNAEILPEPDDWSQGSPLLTMRRLVGYWRDGYDWKAKESELNNFPQFITPIDIDGFGFLNVHFLHVNKGVKNAIPLVMIHGWPGAFYEFTKVLPLFMEHKDDELVFEYIFALNIIML